jgi:hypothetical protein
MRRAEGSLVNRSSIEATAQQKDSMKRARANGGAADILAAEGFLLLGGTRLASRRVAQSLELPIPVSGTFVPVRVTPAEPGCADPVAEAGGVLLRRWRPGDQVMNTTAISEWLNKSKAIAVEP